MSAPIRRAIGQASERSREVGEYKIKTTEYEPMDIKFST